jgi:hypothetical protein
MLNYEYVKIDFCKRHVFDHVHENRLPHPRYFSDTLAKIKAWTARASSLYRASQVYRTSSLTIIILYKILSFDYMAAEPARFTDVSLVASGLDRFAGMKCSM